MSDPFPELRTHRLRLRRFCEDDVHAYAELMRDPTAYAYLRADAPMPEPEARERVAMMRDSVDHVYWALEVDGTFVGYVAAHHIASDVPALSFALRAPFRRQGLMSQALRAVLDYCHSTLDRAEVVARATDDNAPSRAFLQQLGLRCVGAVDTAHGPRQEYRASRPAAE